MTLNISRKEQMLRDLNERYKRDQDALHDRYVKLAAADSALPRTVIITDDRYERQRREDEQLTKRFFAERDRISALPTTNE